MKHYILGLTGFASVGKDTVADLLVAHLHFRKLAFADALRAEVSDGFRVDMVYLTSPSTKNGPMAALSMRRAPIEFLAAVTLAIAVPRNANGRIEDAWLDEPRSPRQIAQWWGTEYRRAQHPHYWTRIMRERITFLERDGGQRFVVTDCRFSNEVDTLRAMGGLLWQVTRPGVDGATTPEGQHTSVTSGAAFEPSAVIANTHDIRHLQQLVLSEFVALDTGIATAKVTV